MAFLRDVNKVLVRKSVIETLPHLLIATYRRDIMSGVIYEISLRGILRSPVT
jgi:hypothetical protein